MKILIFSIIVFFCFSDKYGEPEDYGVSVLIHKDDSICLEDFYMKFIVRFDTCVCNEQEFSFLDKFLFPQSHHAKCAIFSHFQQQMVKIEYFKNYSCSLFIKTVIFDLGMCVYDSTTNSSQIILPEKKICRNKTTTNEEEENMKMLRGRFVEPRYVVLFSMFHNSKCIGDDYVNGQIIISEELDYEEAEVISSSFVSTSFSISNNKAQTTCRKMEKQRGSLRIKTIGLSLHPQEADEKKVLVVEGEGWIMYLLKLPFRPIFWVTRTLSWYWNLSKLGKLFYTVILFLVFLDMCCLRFLLIRFFFGCSTCCFCFWYKLFEGFGLCCYSEYRFQRYGKTIKMGKNHVFVESVRQRSTSRLIEPLQRRDYKHEDPDDEYEKNNLRKICKLRIDQRISTQVHPSNHACSRNRILLSSNVLLARHQEDGSETRTKKELIITACHPYRSQLIFSSSCHSIQFIRTRTVQEGEESDPKNVLEIFIVPPLQLKDPTYNQRFSEDGDKLKNSFIQQNDGCFFNIAVLDPVKKLYVVLYDRYVYHIVFFEDIHDIHPQANNCKIIFTGKLRLKKHYFDVILEMEEYQKFGDVLTKDLNAYQDHGFSAFPQLIILDSKSFLVCFLKEGLIFKISNNNNNNNNNDEKQQQQHEHGWTNKKTFVELVFSLKLAMFSENVVQTKIVQTRRVKQVEKCDDDKHLLILVYDFFTLPNFGRSEVETCILKIPIPNSIINSEEEEEEENNLKVIVREKQDSKVVKMIVLERHHSFHGNYFDDNVVFGGDSAVSNSGKLLTFHQFGNIKYCNYDGEVVKEFKLDLDHYSNTNDSQTTDMMDDMIFRTNSATTTRSTKLYEILDVMVVEKNSDHSCSSFIILIGYKRTQEERNQKLFHQLFWNIFILVNLDFSPTERQGCVVDPPLLFLGTAKRLRCIPYVIGGRFLFDDTELVYSCSFLDEFGTLIPNNELEKRFEEKTFSVIEENDRLDFIRFEFGAMEQNNSSSQTIEDVVGKTTEFVVRYEESLFLDKSCCCSVLIGERKRVVLVPKLFFPS